MDPIIGKITSHFGNRIHPITGKHSFHNGVDVSCKVGTIIHAPFNGRISEIWDHEKGGKCLAMVSKVGFRYGFAHLSKRLVTVEQLVVEGQEIACSGNTGLSTGPHLHFTVKLNDVWQDPLKYFFKK